MELQDHSASGEHQHWQGAESSLSISILVAGFRARWKIFAVTVLVAWVFCAIYLLIASPIYSADTEIIYTKQPYQSSQSSGLAGLASSVGLKASSSDDREFALAVLKSRQVAADFIKRYDLLPILFPEDWNASKKAWRVAQSEVPTPIDGALRWKKVMYVSDNSDTGVISLSVHLPYKDMVAPIANNYVKMADGVLRTRALTDSQQSLTYLETQLSKTNITELRSSITSLMEEAMQRMTLISTRHYYAFNVVDPAIRPRTRTWPRAGLLLVVLTILAIMAAASISATLDLRERGYLP